MLSPIRPPVWSTSIATLESAAWTAQIAPVVRVPKSQAALGDEHQVLLAVEPLHERDGPIQVAGVLHRLDVPRDEAVEWAPVIGAQRPAALPPHRRPARSPSPRRGPCPWRLPGGPACGRGSRACRRRGRDSRSPDSRRRRPIEACVHGLREVAAAVYTPPTRSRRPGSPVSNRRRSPPEPFDDACATVPLVSRSRTRWRGSRRTPPPDPGPNRVRTKSPQRRAPSATAPAAVRCRERRGTRGSPGE